MLWVSKSEYLFDPLQRLRSPSVVYHKAWSHRRLRRSIQWEQRIKSYTSDFKDPGVCRCREDSPRYQRLSTAPNDERS